jgi:hypothetical protein
MRKRISQVIHTDERPLFPISWLHKLEFCEYQIYLENVLGIKVAPTQAMIEGHGEHRRLYDEFDKEAVPATLEEMLLESKAVAIFSRELRVRDQNHGIYGLIDEVLLTPDEFIVIDDKPGQKAYLSNVHQVYGYCLAFQEEIRARDGRPIVAALRERGTDNIYWHTPFRNKCRACRLQHRCRRTRYNAAIPGGSG